MSDAPSILVLTSKASESSVVTPVLAALEAVGSKLRAFDAGRVGGTGSSAVDWVVRAISGEVVERQLEREIDTIRPDAVVCFEVGPTLAVCSLRKSCARPFPVIAVVPELMPSAAWAQCEADRFFVVDDEAAVALEDNGVTGHNIVPVGAIGSVAYAGAGAMDRNRLRERFKLTGKVVLVEVNGLGHEQASQLALQLSLVEQGISYLFDAGGDRDAAAALRAQVPVLGMKAKLFGETDDAPLLWRCADVVVARPTSRAVGRATAVGAALVCYCPRDTAELRVGEAIEDRGRGAVASNALMVGTALGRALKCEASALPAPGIDAAGTIADATWLIGKDREAVLADKVAARSAGRAAEVEGAAEYAQWAASATQPAGDLEDLGSGGPAPEIPDISKIRRLQKEVRERKAQLTRTITDSQKQASTWSAKRVQADKLGNPEMAKTAERNADMERARMHKALTEMASLEAEERGLHAAAEAAAHAPKTRPPSDPGVSYAERESESSYTSGRGSGTSAHSRLSVDEELARLRREAGGSETPKSNSTTKKKSSRSSGKKTRKSGGGVDDELAALKRKMSKNRK
jgi:UDP-N-acetylglucosamine:LPS N-acetylglucosamine transferase